ncbi:electron transfer flavoprotein-quinone oxidoreductase [Natronorubrum sediminis]|uniref:Electron transfer flavoprotein-quinone oxidoreductase n=1 Tax=Natronorubrum sediminis TaxID=640943 RepID=A0A1H6FY93_9EURY|nr:FAD-dependent monooxygenase [Natronorubrum sediminis]SEH14983.1 electron transfer flavoprotein-quinone oxidoreductase [Natronorubrum sediminis]
MSVQTDSTTAAESEYEHYEAIVVGCGPGGAAAAARLADHGVETLVLERGTEAGSKNVSGGLVYAEESAAYTADDLFDGFREAASERPVTEYTIHNIAGNRVKSYDLTDLHEHDTDWCDAVLRREMDSWLEARVHEKTSETGGGVLTDVRVNGLLRENGEIVGVTCDELEPITADVIVAADGVNSELARDAGLMNWDEPDEWFQGVKAVVEMDPDTIDDRFGIDADEGAAHLFSGDLFEDVRGGGFLYTNEDSLSIGTVFHLDSLVEEQAEPHELLDALLTHPLLAQWLGDAYHEREYAAKLVPDSKKVAHREPYRDRLVLVGDAAGQMQAQGPIIKGMNHAITAGALAADAFVVTRGNSHPEAAGRRYTQMLEKSGTMDKLRPRRYELSRSVGERDAVANAVDRVLESPVGSLAVGNPIAKRLMKRAYNSPFLVSMLPDTNTGYVTLPTVIAEEHGRTIRWDSDVEPPTLEERIGDLTYDTDVGNPHIELLDESAAASGAAVSACPVSAQDFGAGCYRAETVQTNGTAETLISLDTQPCIECGTCAVVADTDWEHPRGGKGVEYREG